MAMVDVDGTSRFSADSQPKSTGLVWGLAATRRSVYIHQMNRVISGNDFGHDDSTVVMFIVIIIIIHSNTVYSFRWLLTLIYCCSFSIYFWNESAV